MSLKTYLILVGIIAATILLVLAFAPDADAATRPSQAVAQRQAAFAVSELCGGGSWVCVKRYNPTVFYRCGTNGKCWNACYTHAERRWYAPWRTKYRCSTGKMTGRTGFLDYFFEYPK